MWVRFEWGGSSHSSLSNEVATGWSSKPQACCAVAIASCEHQLHSSLRLMLALGKHISYHLGWVVIDHWSCLHNWLFSIRTLCSIVLFIETPLMLVVSTILDSNRWTKFEGIAEPSWARVTAVCKKVGTLTRQTNKDKATPNVGFVLLLIVWILFFLYILYFMDVVYCT